MNRYFPAANGQLAGMRGGVYTLGLLNLRRNWVPPSGNQARGSTKAASWRHTVCAFQPYGRGTSEFPATNTAEYTPRAKGIRILTGRVTSRIYAEIMSTIAPYSAKMGTVRSLLSNSLSFSSLTSPRHGQTVGPFGTGSTLKKLRKSAASEESDLKLRSELWGRFQFYTPIIGGGSVSLPMIDPAAVHFGAWAFLQLDKASDFWKEDSKGQAKNFQGPDWRDRRLATKMRGAASPAVRSARVLPHDTILSTSSGTLKLSAHTFGLGLDSCATLHIHC